jgi:hypothetical protein
MRLDAGTLAPRAWTIMLADVVALMLAFFVLSFSMRELVPIGPARAPLEPEAVAAFEAPLADQRRELEQERAATPAFAYLAAIIEANSRHALADAIWHDDTRLVVRLPGTVDTSDYAADAAAREVLLALAFLARRFDLDLALSAPRRPGGTLEEGLERAAAIRAWLGETTGLTLDEVSFTAAATGAGSVRAGTYFAALGARPAQVPAPVRAPVPAQVPARVPASAATDP